MHVITPEGYALERTDKVMSELERGCGSCPARNTCSRPSAVRIGRAKGQGSVTEGTIYVRMKELDDRDYSQFAIQQQARKVLADYPDLRASVNDVSRSRGAAGPSLSSRNARA